MSILTSPRFLALALKAQSNMAGALYTGDPSHISGTFLMLDMLDMLDEDMKKEKSK
jgi:hypothetical protein